MKAFGDLVEAVRVQDKQAAVPPTLKRAIDFICKKHRVSISDLLARCWRSCSKGREGAGQEDR